MLKVIITLLVSVFLFFSATAAEKGNRGVSYHKGDVYAALEEAKKTGKLLIVEFYAPWNYKSRWMNSTILADSTIGSFVNESFIVGQINTTTPEGASMARQYEVTDYPCLVVFNESGDVIDKIDRTLNNEDFTARIEQILLVSDGRSAWKLRAIYNALAQDDEQECDRLMADYLLSRPTERMITVNHWPLFESRKINFYYSSAFDFMLRHKETFANKIGRERVDDQIESVLTDAIFPYIVGSVNYDSLIVNDIMGLSANLDLISADRIEGLVKLSKARSRHDVEEYLRLSSTLLRSLSEELELMLILSLDLVADFGDKTQKQRALRIVNNFKGYVNSPSNMNLIDHLSDRLSIKER